MASFFRSSAPSAAGAPQTDAYGNPIGQRPAAPSAGGAGAYSRVPPPPTPPRPQQQQQQPEPPAGGNYSRPSQPQSGRSPAPPSAYGDEKSAHRPKGVGVRGVYVPCLPLLPPQPSPARRHPLRPTFADRRPSLRPYSSFRIEKGTETTAFYNCLIANPADLEGVQCVRVKRSHYVGVK